MAKRLKTRLSAGAAVVTGLSAFGVGLMATPAQAATVWLDYTCSFDVLNVGVTYDAAPVSVDLTVDAPTSVEVGEEIDSAVTADVTIQNEQRDALYGLLGVRAVDGPDAATAAAEDGGLNTKNARNQADFTLTNGTESADGIMPLEVPVTAVPESGDLTVSATGAVEPVTLTHVAAGMGPGPFTGLRVGIAAARAFALGRGLPVVAVPSHDAAALEVFLASALTDPFAEVPRFGIVTDARRREFAYTAYDGIDDDGLPVRVAGPALTPRDEIDTVLAGFGAERRDAVSISAAMLATVAARAVAAGRELTGPEPLYLRAPDITLPRAPKRVTA